MNNLRKDIISVLDAAGIDEKIPRDMVAIAQGFLDNRGIDAESTSIQTRINSEDGTTRVDVNFYLPGNVEEVAELNHQLTKTFIQCFPYIPHEFCITLTPENSV